jgi:hypothetical protein
MRFGPKVLILLGFIAVGGYLVSLTGGPPSAGSREFTFRLTPLTEPPVHVQHGIETFLTLNLLEAGAKRPVRINDLPEFPIIASLDYQTIDGQERKVSSSYGYRC